MIRQAAVLQAPPNLKCYTISPWRVNLLFWHHPAWEIFPFCLHIYVSWRKLGRV